MATNRLVAEPGSSGGLHELRIAGEIDDHLTLVGPSEDGRRSSGDSSWRMVAFPLARRPGEWKGNHPPGAVARAAAAMLRGPEDREVVVDLARYAELVEAAR